MSFRKCRRYVMPESVILIDFGASRVKAIHWSFAGDCAIDSRECPAPKLVYGPRGEAEGEPEHYWEALQATAGQLAEASDSVTDLWICSEMHGFILAGSENKEALTPYISWQDQRACEVQGQAPSKLEELKESLSSKLMQEAGMKLRPGLPIVNLATMCAELQRFGRVRFLTLIDWLLLRGGEPDPRCNRTIAAGTGLYSLVISEWSDELMRSAGIEASQLQMPTLHTDNAKPIGNLELSGRRMNVWGGLGDLQAAAHGMGFPNISSVLLNLGTGSQIMVRTDARVENLEVRVCAEGEWVHAITHIPAGRALNAYARFIDGCAIAGDGNPCFWRIFSELTAEEVLAAEPCIDLNVFSAAWHYSRGGSVCQILENSFSPRWFMRSLVRSWLTQYVHALESIPAGDVRPTFVLGGGLSRRSTFIPIVLDALLGKKSLRAALRTGEETLDGLLLLAETYH